MRQLRVLGSTGAAVLLSLSLVACGGSETPESAEPAASSESEALADAESLAEGDEVEPAAFVAATKAAVQDNPSAHFTMEVRDLLSAEGDLAYEPVAMQMTMTATGMDGIEMRLVDGTFYLSVPGQTPDGTFVKLDESTPGLGQLLGQLRSLGPQSTFDAFEAGLEKAVYVREEEVDGETLDEFELTVDAAAAVEAQGLEGGQVPPGMPETLTYRLALDEQNLMRRVDVEVMGTSTTMTLSQWGEPVEVEAPAADDLVDMPGMAG